MKPLPMIDDPVNGPVPTNWDEMTSVMKAALEPDDIEFLKEHGAICTHHTFGMWIRNNWGLWRKESPLHQWFVNECGLGHADDMSGCLLEWLDDYVSGDEFDLQKKAAHYHAYWNKMGINPQTQEKW